MPSKGRRTGAPKNTAPPPPAARREERFAPITHTGRNPSGQSRPLPPPLTAPVYGTAEEYQKMMERWNPETSTVVDPYSEARFDGPQDSGSGGKESPYSVPEASGERSGEVVYASGGPNNNARDETSALYASMKELSAEQQQAEMSPGGVPELKNRKLNSEEAKALVQKHRKAEIEAADKLFTDIADGLGRAEQRRLTAKIEKYQADDVLGQIRSTSRGSVDWDAISKRIANKGSRFTERFRLRRQRAALSILQKNLNDILKADTSELKDFVFIDRMLRVMKDSPTVLAIDLLVDGNIPAIKKALHSVTLEHLTVSNIQAKLVAIAQNDFLKPLVVEVLEERLRNATASGLESISASLKQSNSIIHEVLSGIKPHTGSVSSDGMIALDTISLQNLAEHADSLKELAENSDVSMHIAKLFDEFLQTQVSGAEESQLEQLEETLDIFIDLNPRDEVSYREKFKSAYEDGIIYASLVDMPKSSKDINEVKQRAEEYKEFDGKRILNPNPSISWSRQSLINKITFEALSGEEKFASSTLKKEISELGPAEQKAVQQHMSTVLAQVTNVPEEMRLVYLVRLAMCEPDALRTTADSFLAFETSKAALQSFEQKHVTAAMYRDKDVTARKILVQHPVIGAEMQLAITAASKAATASALKAKGTPPPAPAAPPYSPGPTKTASGSLGFDGPSGEIDKVLMKKLNHTFAHKNKEAQKAILTHIDGLKQPADIEAANVTVKEFLAEKNPLFAVVVLSKLGKYGAGAIGFHADLVKERLSTFLDKQAFYDLAPGNIDSVQRRIHVLKGSPIELGQGITLGDFVEGVLKDTAAEIQNDIDDAANIGDVENLQKIFPALSAAKNADAQTGAINRQELEGPVYYPSQRRESVAGSSTTTTRVVQATTAAASIPWGNVAGLMERSLAGRGPGYTSSVRSGKFTPKQQKSAIQNDGAKKGRRLMWKRKSRKGKTGKTSTNGNTATTMFSNKTQPPSGSPPIGFGH